jgi:hypothetical protein
MSTTPSLSMIWEQRPENMARGYIQTGQTSCYDNAGTEISCFETGQDGEYRKGIEWAEPRFQILQEMVIDHLTGLYWTIDANLSGYPLTWQEALDFVAGLNRNHYQGHGDWRLPNRKELRSLISHQTARPPLPEHHPFQNVFSGWYWTSTAASRNRAFAWYIHMGGGRMFYGRKDEFHLLWPVRGKRRSPLLLTGQFLCYDLRGNPISCESTGQDGELTDGFMLPQPRFRVMEDGVTDVLTGLVWFHEADLGRGTVTWEEAFGAIRTLNREKGEKVLWRLPNINELETLVDCSECDPALPLGHPFRSVQEAYWSSTTSIFESDWAWALYLDKGAVGVGQKSGRHFHVWGVGN